MLVHWLENGLPSGSYPLHSRFQLLDVNRRPVWSLERALNQEEWRREWERWRRSSLDSVLVPSSRTFELRVLADEPRVTFTVEPSNDGWLVREKVPEASKPARKRPR